MGHLCSLLALVTLLTSTRVSAQDPSQFDRPAPRPLVGAVTTPDTSSPATTAPEFPWVGAVADRVYFRATCAPAQDLAASNRRYFRTRQDAERSGYRHSRTRGC